MLALSVSLFSLDNIGRDADLILGLPLVGETPGVLVDGHGPEGPGRCGAAIEAVLEVSEVELVVRVVTKDHVLVEGSGIHQVCQRFGGLGQVL